MSHRTTFVTTAPLHLSREDSGALCDTGPVGVEQRMSSLDFVGRAGELDVLASALDSAAEGKATTVLVGGEAGIGKTRLLDEFGRVAHERGALLATGVCLPVGGESLPFGPLVSLRRDLVKQAGDSASQDPFDVFTSEAGRPAPREEMHGPVVPDPYSKTRLFEGILEWLVRMAQRSVLVLVVEDVQWADTTSTEVLGFLARNLGDSRVLLVVSYRAEDVGRSHPLRPWLVELARHSGVRSLVLDRLNRDETEGLIKGILGHQPEWTLLEAVWARSQGNPFFTEELIAARHNASLSAELRGVLLSRVETLSADAQHLAELVAVAGPLVDHRLLEAVNLLGDGALEAAVAEAVDKQILVVDPTGLGYRFRHALIQEAVEGRLLPGVRRRLHRRVAEVLEADVSLDSETSGHHAAQVANHWWAAGDWAKVICPCVEAADAAIAVWAFPEALAQLDHALAALGRVLPSAVPPGVDRLTLLEKAADIAYLTTEHQRAGELAREAVAAVDPVADPARAARALAVLGRNAWAVGDSEAALDACRQAAFLLPSDTPSVELARVLAEEARWLMLMSRYGEAELRCEDALDVSRAVGDRDIEGHALNTMGCCRGALGRWEEGVALVRDALVIAEEVASPDAVNRAYGNLAHLYMEMGRLEECAAVALDSAVLSEERWGVRLNSATANAADALIRLGRFDEAQAILDELGKGYGSCVPTPYMLPAVIAIRRGRFDEADRLLAVADDLTSALSDVWQRGNFHLHVAEGALARGRPADAYEHIEHALALSAGSDDRSVGLEMRSLGVRALVDALEMSRVSDRRMDAVKTQLLASELVIGAEEIISALGPEGAPPRALALLATIHAEQTRLDGSDPDLWAAAVELWERASEPYPAAYCRWREAEALLEQRTGRSRAVASLSRAYRDAAKMGAEPLLDGIEGLAGRARIALGDPDDLVATEPDTLADDLGLTSREVQVLAQLAAGRTDREIAEALYISRKTASVHVSNLLRKLDVANRVEAGKLGQVHGLR